MNRCNGWGRVQLLLHRSIMFSFSHNNGYVPPYLVQERLGERMTKLMIPPRQKFYIFISRHINIQNYNSCDKFDEKYYSRKVETGRNAHRSTPLFPFHKGS